MIKFASFLILLKKYLLFFTNNYSFKIGSLNFEKFDDLIFLKFPDLIFLHSSCFFVDDQLIEMPIYHAYQQMILNILNSFRKRIQHNYRKLIEKIFCFQRIYSESWVSEANCQKSVWNLMIFFLKYLETNRFPFKLLISDLLKVQSMLMEVNNLVFRGDYDEFLILIVAIGDVSLNINFFNLNVFVYDNKTMIGDLQISHDCVIMVQLWNQEGFLI